MDTSGLLGYRFIKNATFYKHLLFIYLGKKALYSLCEFSAKGDERNVSPALRSEKKLPQQAGVASNTGKVS